MKSRKIEIFHNGLVHGFCQKKGQFSAFFIWGNTAQENVFYDILEPKNTFLGHENNKFKKSKNWDFSTGVIPWFWSKKGNFSVFFYLRQYSPGKCVLWYSRTKNVFLFYENKKFKKSKNWFAFKGVSPWFWSKKAHFSVFFIWDNIAQENVFYDILERKNTFLGMENNKFKKSKNWDFSKKVSPWFWSKKGHFSVLLF